MKLEELEAILSRVKEEYSEDRWITLIDPCGDSSPPDTYEAGYNAALSTHAEIAHRLTLMKQDITLPLVFCG